MHLPKLNANGEVIYAPATDSAIAQLIAISMHENYDWMFSTPEDTHKKWFDFFSNKMQDADISTSTKALCRDYLAISAAGLTGSELTEHLPIGTRQEFIESHNISPRPYRPKTQYKELLSTLTPAEKEKLFEEFLELKSFVTADAVCVPADRLRFEVLSNLAEVMDAAQLSSYDKHGNTKLHYLAGLGIKPHNVPTILLDLTNKEGLTVNDCLVETSSLCIASKGPLLFPASSKIDMSFVEDINTPAAEKELFKAAVEYATSLGWDIRNPFPKVTVCKVIVDDIEVAGAYQNLGHTLKISNEYEKYANPRIITLFHELTHCKDRQIQGFSSEDSHTLDKITHTSLSSRLLVMNSANDQQYPNLLETDKKEEILNQIPKEHHNSLPFYTAGGTESDIRNEFVAGLGELINEINFGTYLENNPELVPADIAQAIITRAKKTKQNLDNNLKILPQEDQKNIIAALNIVSTMLNQPELPGLQFAELNIHADVDL